MFQGSCAQLRLLDKIAAAHKITPEQLELRRDILCRQARILAYYVLRLSGLSTVQIGYVMSKDHSTILSGLKKVTPAIKEKGSLYFEWYCSHFPLVYKDKIGYRLTEKELLEKTKGLLNGGHSDIKEMAKHLKIKPDYMERVVKDIVENSPKKKVPNYKNSTTREIFI